MGSRLRRALAVVLGGLVLAAAPNYAATPPATHGQFESHVAQVSVLPQAPADRLKVLKVRTKLRLICVISP